MSISATGVKITIDLQFEYITEMVRAGSEGVRGAARGAGAMFANFCACFCVFFKTAGLSGFLSGSSKSGHGPATGLTFRLRPHPW